MPRKILNEIKNHFLIYTLLFITVVGGFFFRVYHINTLLGFYFDQGRDALAVWNIWHGGDIPFIGPTTGIAGILRGPFYFWLIAPFYLIGNGNPIWPSVFLSATTMLAVVLIYCLGLKIQDRVTGLIAAIIASFSYNIIMASRWLSNPTPMLLFSILFLWCLLFIVEGKKHYWIWAVLMATVSLFHFGSAGEVFYFLALLILLFWQRRSLPGRKIVFITLFLSFVTILPLIAFDIKNHGILAGNIRDFLFAQGSFRLPSSSLIGIKINFYYDVFTSKIFNGRLYFERILLGFIALFFVYHLRKLEKIRGVKITLLLLGSVCFGLIFFQGNFGNIYDYYLTGYYLPFVLLFSIAVGYMWRWNLGKVFVIYFIYIFLISNTQVLKGKLNDSGLGPHSISFTAQKKAIDWVYRDAEGEAFNVDVYVPPVIPYAYDYLFKWLGNTKYAHVPSEENQSILYTLYEKDPDHQGRLDAWYARQKGIAKIISEKEFGAVVVQKRERIVYGE